MNVQTAHYLIQTHLEMKLGVVPALDALRVVVPRHKRMLEDGGPRGASKRLRVERPAARWGFRVQLSRHSLSRPGSL